MSEDRAIDTAEGEHARRLSVIEKEQDLSGRVDGKGRVRFEMRTRLPTAQRWTLRMAAVDAASVGSLGPFDISQDINAARISELPTGGRLLSARLGPDEWLLIEEAQQHHPSPVAAAQSELVVASLVDVSHRAVAVEVTGVDVRDVLNTGCPLPLSDAALPEYAATRTVFGKAEIVLIRLANSDQAPRYRIEIGRSFGRYLCEHLRDSASLLGLL